MGTRKYKPTTQGLRQRSVSDFDVVTSSKAQKSLVRKLNRKAGRNNLGRITVRRKSGGVKKLYRLIDFKRDKAGIKGTVKSIEYDPNRTSYIALVVYEDGDKRYILSTQKMAVGENVLADENADIKPGNTIPIKNIPTGTLIHNIEVSKGKGGQIARAAGAYGLLMAKTGKSATVKLPSGEIRLVSIECLATIGQVGNSEKRNTSKGKAGVSRWLGKRPKVRGAVMNACDHPHGGGEGKAPVGLKGPVSPWGKCIYNKTVRKKRKYILRGRK
ncbi:50S ribosomal protein L2 [Candidatus Margulisiibacteriota bacterium]